VALEPDGVGDSPAGPSGEHREADIDAERAYARALLAVLAADDPT
jgi:hypothetical protein